MIDSLGYELVDVEIKKEGKDKILYVFISNEDGISLEDCSAVTEAIDPIIEELDPIKDSYYLCVSSTGDRKFKYPRDFIRNIDKEIEINLYQQVEGRKKLVGVLKEYNPDLGYISVEFEKKLLQIEIKNLSRVRPYIGFSDITGGNR